MERNALGNTSGRTRAREISQKGRKARPPTTPFFLMLDFKAFKRCYPYLVTRNSQVRIKALETAKKWQKQKDM